MKVVVLQGGPSSEAEVSRKSAQAVAQALALAGHEAVRMELTEDLPVELSKLAFDVVFPAVHGRQGEDGCLQGLLEVMAVPYVGSDVLASAISADKLAAKMFFRQAGLTVAGERALSPSDCERHPAELLSDLRQGLGPAFVLKPVQGGSTIGIERIFQEATAEEFSSALQEAFRHDDTVMAETYVSGQELTCAVLEDESGPRALPVTLITSEANDWYDFESKYAPGGSSHQCPAPLDEVVTERVQRAAVAAHVALGARDLSRTDFILTASGTPYVLELNTLPGMTEVSLYPEAARAAGIGFSELMDRFVARALARGVRRSGQGRPLPGREI